jgi:hypothetical protein
MKTKFMERKCLYYKNITEIQYQSHKNLASACLMTNLFPIVLAPNLPERIHREIFRRENQRSQLTRFKFLVYNARNI